MTNRPTLLSQAMVDRALKDSTFFSVVPEFAQLRSPVTKTTISPSRGCSGCGRNKQTVNAFKNFTLVASSLTKEGQDRLKRYYGVTGIMMNAVDNNSKQVTLKVI